MRDLVTFRYPLLWAIALVLGGIPATSARTAPEAEPKSDDYWITQAEQYRTSDDPVQSARAYRAAYDAMSPADQTSLMGEITIGNAIADYRLARERQPDDRALVQEPLAVIDEFIAARDAAHRAGQAEPVPELISAEQARLRARLQELQASQTIAGPEPAPVAVPPPAKPSTPEPPPPPFQPFINPILVGAGVTGMLGGISLIVVGSVNFGQIDRLTRDQLAALDSSSFNESDRDRYRTQLDQWERQQKGVATALVVTGSVLGAAGIGLTTWGSIRMLRSGHPRNNQRAFRITPRLSRGGGGLTTTVDF